MFRKKEFIAKRVRIHHIEMVESFEGLWIGMADNHYRLRAVKLLKPNDFEFLEAAEILLPQAKVAFVEVLSVDASV